jgi:hypothetical protein
MRFWANWICCRKISGVSITLAHLFVQIDESRPLINRTDFRKCCAWANFNILVASESVSQPPFQGCETLCHFVVVHGDTDSASAACQYAQVAGAGNRRIEQVSL